MNLPSIRFHAGALRELRATMRRYNEQVQGLGDDFVTGVEAALARIAANPEAGSPQREGTRRMRVRRFPHNVVYAQRGDGIIVIAVAHHRRRPEYWRTRL